MSLYPRNNGNLEAWNCLKYSAIWPPHGARPMPDVGGTATTHDNTVDLGALSVVTWSDLSLVHLVLYPIAVELPPIGPHISACRYRFANESVHLSASRLVGRESALCLHRACHCWWSFPEQVSAWIQIPSRINSFVSHPFRFGASYMQPSPHMNLPWPCFLAKDWLQTRIAEFWWRRQKTWKYVLLQSYHPWKSRWRLIHLPTARCPDHPCRAWYASMCNSVVRVIIEMLSYKMTTLAKISSQHKSIDSLPARNTIPTLPNCQTQPKSEWYKYVVIGTLGSKFLQVNAQNLQVLQIILPVAFVGGSLHSHKCHQHCGKGTLHQPRWQGMDSLAVLSCIWSICQQRWEKGDQRRLNGKKWKKYLDFIDAFAGEIFGIKFNHICTVLVFFMVIITPGIDLKRDLLFVKRSTSVLSASARVPMPSHMSLPLPSFMSWAHSTEASFLKRPRTIYSCDAASNISRYFKSSVSMSRKWQAPLCTHLRRQRHLRKCTCGTWQQLVSGWSRQSEFGGNSCCSC